jgi:hypothetical protein
MVYDKGLRIGKGGFAGLPEPGMLISFLERCFTRSENIFLSIMITL